jgi:hypothetical protein
MKLTDILREIEDGEENKGQDVKIPNNMVLTPIGASLQKLEDALDDDSNYETYSRNVQNVGSAALQSRIEQEQAKIFGPTGKGIKDRTPNAKVAKAKELWDTSDIEWKKSKAKDIKNRFPEFDITGWEELDFSELPKEARKYNVFWDFITGPKLDALIARVKSEFSTSEKPLNWKEEDGRLVFPPDLNPGFKQVEKIVTTVMKNAGITGKDQYTINPEPIKNYQLATPTKTDAAIKPIEFKDVDESIAYDIKDEIESSYPNLTVSIFSSEDSSLAVVRIKGFTSNQERIKVQGEANQILSDLSENLTKKQKVKESLDFDFEKYQMLRRAGIIK